MVLSLKTLRIPNDRLEMIGVFTVYLLVCKAPASQAKRVGSKRKWHDLEMDMVCPLRRYTNNSHVHTITLTITFITVP